MGWPFLSSRRVILVALSLLLLLDVARSLYARVGYADPVEAWQPDPSQYADLTWPPGASLPADTPTGARIFAQRCAVCHGPAAPSLIPHPRDFTKGQFKYTSTPADQPPTDEDLIRVVTHGLTASAMPYWSDLLSEQEILAVVELLKSLSPMFTQGTPTPLTIPPRPPPDAENIARGAQLFRIHGCATCHGPDGRGGVRLKDANGYEVVSRDLTAPWTFRGGATLEQIWLRLTTGLAPSPMPSFAEKTTPTERWDLVNYVLSLSRIPPWEPGGKLDGPGQSADPIKHGAYLIRAEMCGLCHTQINPTGIYRGDDFYLAGGMRVDVGAHGHLVSRNLTSDRTTGLGGWTSEQIIEALRNGRAPDRILNVLDMPWNYFHAWPDDAQAIAGFLQTLPPVQNQIPPTLHYGVVETVVRKLTRPWPAFPPEVLVFVDGNFGQLPDAPPRDWPQQVLSVAQWCVVGLGAVLSVIARPAPRRNRRHGTGWWQAARPFIPIFIGGVLGWAVYHLPAVSFVPPDQIATQFLNRVPLPTHPERMSTEQTALVERGRLLYTVASCALCHHPEGDGGLKISWKAFGTLWTRNITPDPETDIGAWNDREIARAIRSGVTPDGRMLHWQGMIWDHASNLDEEDLRAIIAFLRTLPPVSKEIPSARPPTEDDCDKYTFWISESDRPGCI